jgi:hypothetical protein
MHTSHQTGENLNLSVLSEPERKCGLIKEIQRFLEKDIEKFVGDGTATDPALADHRASKVAQR